MVEGKCREKFVMNVLEPYFCKQIGSNSDNINSFNKEMCSNLNSSNSMFNCPYCDTRTVTSSKLKIHLKSFHTRPELSSPENRKQIKLINSEKDETFNEGRRIAPALLKVVDLFECKKCEFVANFINDLEKHGTDNHSTNKSDIGNDDPDVHNQAKEEEIEKALDINRHGCSGESIRASKTPIILVSKRIWKLHIHPI